MKLLAKTTLFSATLTVAMILVLALVSLVSFRQFSIISAREHTRTTAEAVRVGLTELMVNGVIAHRANFLKRVAGIEGLKSARVVRGPAVIQQFGAGLPEEQQHDEIEARVLASGKPYFALQDTVDEPIFRSTIPFTAHAKGDPDCLQCHHVRDGTVLGAVTLTLSIAHLKNTALITVGLTVAVVAAFALLILLFFRRMIRPLASTAGEIQMAVEQAVLGDFSVRVEPQTDDEVGQIAKDFNQLTAFLDRGLGEIRNNVAHLIRCQPSDNENMLANTMSMVEGLVAAAHFKQSIEEDETKREVYQRLARVIEEDFYVERFSIYEVAASKNRMTAVVVDGVLGDGCRWCDQQILIRSEACRARRTGHVVSSLETPHICNAFQPPESAEGLHYICLPVIQSGTVGSVVQLVVDLEHGRRIERLTAFVKVYLREAAPVIEAKRLMDTLRESTLRDPMTGLHNRRFLEEYVDTLVAATQRHKTQVSILMLDLDYFKKVNDTYGHDAGDSVLKALAKTLRQAVRASDLVVRYGGEEFLILLQETSDGYGDEVAEKIRAAVEAMKVELPAGMLQKTISIGVADFPNDSETFWQAVKYADVALYRAKETGRNRVVHFTPDLWTNEEQY